MPIAIGVGIGVGFGGRAAAAAPSALSSPSPSVAADGTQGTAYPGQTFAATGGTTPYTWSATGLPPGLSLNASTGALTGTPTTSGAYNPVVTVTDAVAATANVTCNLVVLPSFAFANTQGAANDTVTFGYRGTTFTSIMPVVTTWSYTPTIYVATTGSDTTGTGSFGSPFATISKAVSVAVPDSVIQVAGGTYVEQVVFTTANQGTSGHPVVLTIANGAAPGSVLLRLPSALVQSTPSSPNILIDGASYITINGLALEGALGRSYAPASEHFTACNVTTTAGVAGYGNNIIVQNCFGYNAVHSGFKTKDSGADRALNNQVLSCVWLGGGTTGLDHGIYLPASSGTIRGNIAAGWPGYGYQIYTSPSGTTLNKSIAFGNASGGIILGGDTSTITNNVLDQNNPGFGMYYRGTFCTGNAVNHNLCTNNAGGDCSVDPAGGSPPSNNTDASNDYYPGGVSSDLNGLNGNTVTSDTNEDPMYLNAATADYRVAGNSSDGTKGAYPSYWGLSMTPSGSALAGTNGVAYSQAFSASGGTGPYTYSLLYGTLPTGLSLSSGTLSGTPTVTGAFAFAVKAVDSLGAQVVNVYALTVSPTVYVLDTFTGTSGTLLTAHTADTNQGSGWTSDSSGNFKLNGTGLAIRENSGDFDINTINGGHADATWKVDISFSAAGSGNGIVFRSDGTTSNYWRVTYNSGTPQLTLSKVVAGATTDVATASGLTLNTGTTYTMEVRTSGNTIQFYLNGTHIVALDATDSFNATATRGGLYSGNNTPTPTSDNFKITA